MIVLWALPTHGYRPLKLGLIITAGTLIPTWLLMFLVNPPISISVGEGWLAMRTWRRARWVRTDELAKVKVLTPQTIVLKDRDGRKLRMSSKDLCWNPKLFEIFTQGLRHSVETGMKPMDRTTLGFCGSSETMAAAGTMRAVMLELRGRC